MNKVIITTRLDFESKSKILYLNNLIDRTFHTTHTFSVDL